MIEKVKNLEAYNQRKEMIRLTIDQIRKDFQWYDEDLNIEQNESSIVDQLRQKVMTLVNRMLELDTYRFFQLMYVVDIPESEVKRCLLNKKDVKGIEELVDLIIKRELQKVLIREHFKQQS